MIILIIELNKPEPYNMLQFDVGDILIFDSEYPYIYFLVIYDLVSSEYKLLSLTTYKSAKGSRCLSDLIKNANSIEANNGDRLIEVIKSNQVVVSRTTTE